MKKAFLLIFTFSILILSGCKINNTAKNQYPQGYTAKESGDMLIISNSNGKIIIGGFIPSIGHPQVDEKDITFQMITYTKDPKIEVGALPAALYYRNNDIKTKNELLEILKSMK